VSPDGIDDGTASASGAAAGPAAAEAPDALDDVDDAARGLVLVVFAQLLALHHSLAHGLTPDDPFPSGTVNRVVRGVIIHPLPQPA